MEGLAFRALLPPALGALVFGLLAGLVVDGALAPALAAAAGAATGAMVAAGWQRRAARNRSSLPPLRAERVGETPLPAGYGRFLLDRVPLGILLIDRRAQVQFENPMAARLFGRRPAGSFPVAALRAPRLARVIEAALASGAAGEFEFGLARAGDAHLKASVLPLDDTPEPAVSAPALLVVIEDQSQARRAQELHRDFVANASHELKTPLASISGIIDTLTGHARDDPEATERFLGIMAGQVERMRRLVEDLLSLNRIEINERIRPEEPQRIRRIAWETAETLRPVAEEAGIALSADPPEDLPLVLGDREELTQLFANLIDNAIKYGRPGGTVAVRVLEGGPGAARIGIAVSDQGVGIAREHLPRLTERFYRVSVSHSRARGGTGLGLAIVKHILNRHRGELAIESTPGQGSTFTVWLPVHHPEVLGSAANPG